MKPIQHASDTQLIHLFRDGNSRALEVLVLRYKNKIFTSILYLVKDKYLAEDIFQDVFIRVIDTLRKNRYIEDGKFLPWVMRIAHNLCIDHFRKIRHSPFVRIGDDRDAFEMVNLFERASDVKVMQAELYDQVRDNLDTLPKEQREVLVLRHYGDLSFKEIADMTNCSVNTALGRMRYGLINMRKMFPENPTASL
ncbi:sigma-70 family RNA polymerase sigma factor [Segetibacter sp. 3557_3]|uniref:RNA polymerase sigma factor n=1 Tax=Segetibacter sp. 3557_3 TaxID=2547429 RepID=UPI001058CFE0|nr:sigma-70 family RNA polymerase sigma factor [Segetibacter sp. 3557_3]TDH23025.1 sigma-70 family RNA polymerase sigma factor [Segetibacter sp. 3557_3]